MTKTMLRELQEDLRGPCNYYKLTINANMNDIYFKGWRDWDEYKDQDQVEVQEETPSNVINLLEAINELREEQGC